MGRTKRHRNKRECRLKDCEQINVIKLQKSMKLKCPFFKISYFKDTGRGVLAKKKIKKGDVLIALPFFHLITTKIECKIFSVLKTANLSSHLLLTVWLVFEDHLKKESKYSDYIESLPCHYTNLYFCSEEEKKWLPEFILKEWISQRNSLKKTIVEFFEILENKTCGHCQKSLKEIFDIDKFIWAWFTVNTRSVYYKDNSNINSLALAPFLDMFNHSSSAETKMIIDFDKKFYILKTLIEYKKYEQIFIKYGPHSNLKLLIEYGFILPKNQYDFVEFRFKEVINGAVQTNPDFGNISELKHSFIKEYQLNKNLSKNEAEFSWNFQGLLYVLVTKDDKKSHMLSKLFSQNFSSEEQELIKEIGAKIALTKSLEFCSILTKMEDCKSCTESFKIVKNLIKIYIDLLK